MDEEGIVWPGNKHTYTWTIPRNYKSLDETSELNKCHSSYYYSAVDPIKDMHSGLIGILNCNLVLYRLTLKIFLLQGPLLICSQASIDDNAEVHALDQDFYVCLKGSMISLFSKFLKLRPTLFNIEFDETKNWYYYENIDDGNNLRPVNINTFYFNPQ